MKNSHKIKLIAASVALIASFGAVAGLGGLNVQSRLGQPFSGTITVTGEEAKALLNGGKASVSNGSLRASVRKSGDKAIVSLRSAKPVHDPVLIFQVGVGSQAREYTAIIDPAGYNGQTDGAARVHAQSRTNRFEAPAADSSRRAARERINRVVHPQAARSQTAVRNKQQDKKAVVAGQTQKTKPAAKIAYGQRHLVRPGETLTSIATRLRPQGMTIAQTMQALVNANPQVFVDNDADRMLAGKVLSVPMRSEFKKLAEQPSRVHIEEAQAATPAAHEHDDAHAHAAPAASEPMPSESVRPAEAPAAPAPQPQAASAVDTGASAPAVASESAMPAESSAVDTVATETAASAVQPVRQEPAADVAEEGDGSMWRWLLIGGAALLALLLLARLLGKRNKPQDEPVFVEPPLEPQPEKEVKLDNSVFESQSLDKPVKAAAVSAVAASAAHSAAEGELEMEDDFDDDIFFTDVEQPQVVGQSDAVKLDLNSLDNSQSGILSGAVTHDAETEKRRHLDWDEVESTDSVYEPDTENPYVSAAAPAAAVVTGTTVTAVAESFKESPQPEPVKEEQSWDFFAEAPQAPKAEEKAAAEPFAFEDKPSENTLADNISFETDVPSRAEAAAFDEPLEFTTDAAEPQSFEAAEPEAAFETETVIAETQAEPELFDVKSDREDGLAFQDSEDLSVTAAEIAEPTETIQWESMTLEEPVEEARSESGFISESVGMTAPLEAKYELAKMYVEISDPDAARETLNELIEEAHGSILSKAKNMLKDLGN